MLNRDEDELVFYQYTLMFVVVFDIFSFLLDGSHMPSTSSIIIGEGYCIFSSE